MDITQGCVKCTNRWVSLSRMPPCHRANAQAEASGAVVVHFLRPNEVGSDCPMSCSLQGLQWLTNHYGKHKIAVNGNEVSLSTAQLALERLVSEMHTYRKTPIENKANAAAVSSSTGYYQTGDGRWQYKDQWVLVMSWPDSKKWDHFLPAYLKTVTSQSIGVPSSWSLTTTQGGEGSLPIRVVISGGAAKGDIFIKQDGANQTVKLSYTAVVGSAGMGFLKKIKFGGGGGAAAFPSMGYRILLGKLATGMLNKDDFIGQFYMLTNSLSVFAGGSQSVIWFGVPGAIPKLDNAELAILAIRCKAIGRIMGTGAALPGFGVGLYYGRINTATEVND